MLNPTSSSTHHAEQLTVPVNSRCLAYTASRPVEYKTLVSFKTEMRCYFVTVCLVAVLALVTANHLSFSLIM